MPLRDVIDKVIYRRVPVGRKRYRVEDLEVAPGDQTMSTFERWDGFGFIGDNYRWLANKRRYAKTRTWFAIIAPDGEDAIDEQRDFPTKGAAVEWLLTSLGEEIDDRR